MWPRNGSVHYLSTTNEEGRFSGFNYLCALYDSLTSMSNKVLIIIIVNISIAVVIARLIFQTIRNFFTSIYYTLYPNILSIIQGKFDRDFTHTYKLLFFLFILGVITLIEVKVFY